MGFLSPALLLLGLAVAVPLVLHLFQRHQGPRVVFPAVRYLRRAERESARRVRLRQMLLLALRLAVILLIALAAARPFLPIGGSGHEPTAVAIVLDNSMSSAAIEGDRRVLDVLQARALQTVAAAGPDDRFWLIRAGAPDEPAIPGDAPATAARIRATAPTAGAADLPAAIARARTLLAAGADHRAPEIEVLSDLQASGFGAPLPAGKDAPPLVLWVGDSRVPPNDAVADAEVGGGLPPRAGQRSTASAAVTGTRKDSVGVRLVLDGRVQGAAIAPAGASVVLPFPARDSGLAAGWIEIDADALHADDRRYFAVRVEPPPAVALAGSLPFVDAALAVLADAGRIHRAASGAADVLIAPGGAGIESGASGGTVVVLPPTAPTELPALNGRLATAGIPWRYDPPTLTGEARFAPSPDSGELSRALSDARLQQVYGLRHEGPASGDTVLLRLADGATWAVRGARPGGGRYILVASTFNPEASTLPTSSAMLPLLDHLTGLWASARGGAVALLPGERVPLPDAADAVERPDGTHDAVQPGEVYAAPPLAGIYRILSNGGAVGAFAVNPPPSESDLTRLPPGRVDDALPGWTIRTADDAAAWRASIYRARLGRETWWPLAALLLLLLLIEGWVAASGRRAAVGTAAPAAARGSA